MIQTNFFYTRYAFNHDQTEKLNYTYTAKKLEISRQYGTTLQTNKIKVKILSTFIYEKRISAVYNLFSTIIQFSYLNEIE